MRQLSLCLTRSLALVGLLLFVARAEARPVHFTGPHPVAAKFGGGYCFLEAPHVHAYAPDHAPLYTQVGDEYVFTGDPTPFGYEGEKHTYYGHHPIAAANGEPIYCYLNGPHFHAGAAPPSDHYKIKKGVAFYVGPYAPSYAVQKPKRVKLVNAEYRPYVAMRPTVEVEPPSEWQGEVYAPEPVAAVEVNAPAAPAMQVQVNAPAPPAVQVQVNAPPPPHVVVSAPAPHVVVSAPPPPHVVVTGPRVVFGAPPPPHVVVGGPRVVVGGGVYVKGGRHDRGKHKGWYK